MANSVTTIGTRKVGRREFAELGRPVVSADQIKRYTLRVASSVLAEEQARGFDRDPRVIVDRKFDRPEAGVKPFGRIEYRQRATLAEVVEWVYREVTRISPFLTGTYQNSHLVLVNGVVVSNSGAGPLPEFESLPRDAVVRVVNVTPYARKIEGAKGRRKGGREPLSSQAPSGVYRVVYRKAQRKFGGTSFLKYAFVTLEGSAFAYTLRQGGYDADRKKTYSNALQFFPSIEIRASRGTR